MQENKETGLFGDLVKTVVDVRAAGLKDSAEIARLSVELGYKTTPADIEARLSAVKDSDRHFVAVAVGEMAILGWIAAEERVVLESGEQTEIVGLVVDPDFRKSGVGKSLIASVERWAQGRGQGRIVVRSNVARSESHPFFQGVGFSRSKTQHVYVKNLRPGHAVPTS